MVFFFFSKWFGLSRKRMYELGGVARGVVKKRLCVSVINWEFFCLGSGSSYCCSAVWRMFPRGTLDNFFNCSEPKVHSCICTAHRKVPQLTRKLMTETSRNHGGIVRLGCNWTSTLYKFFGRLEFPAQRQVAGCHVCRDWTALSFNLQQMIS